MENPTLPQKPGPNFLVWIAVAVVTLAIGIGVGLAIGKYSSKAQISSYDDCVKTKGSRIQESYPATCVTASGQRFIQPVSAPTATPTEITDSTINQAPNSNLANWKTYSNLYYGFEVQYPANYFIKSINAASNLDFILQFWSGELPPENSDIVYPFSLQILPIKKSVDQDWKETISSLQLEKITEDELIIRENKAIKFTGKSMGFLQDAPHYSKVYISNKNNRTFVFEDTGMSNNPELFDQILSTFRFTN